MSKTTVIYHRADYDGIFCREIARKFLPEAELIGWDYGDARIPFPAEGRVYILDLAVDGVFGMAFGEEGHLRFLERVVWIDHHKSSIETHNPTIPGYRIDGVAACRLAWQWFQNYANWDGGQEGPHLPTKEEYVGRKVDEPMAVRLAGEYDIWDKRDPDAETFQFGLRSRELTQENWKWLLTVHDNMKQGEYELAKTGNIITELLQDGEMLQNYQRRNDTMAMASSFVVDFEGLHFLALNTPAKSSLAFASKDVPETGHDALLKFNWNGKLWDVSMYHAKHRTDLDLSLIAVKHGGGGHRGACGFRAEKLPFLP